MAVPTGEGLMGYVVGKTIEAANGDMVQFWCVKSASGTDFGYLYYNAGAKKYSWMGGCFFAEGINDYSVDPKIAVVGNKIVLAGFGTPTWSNYAPPNGAMNQTKSDWDFSYDPTKNNLTVASTTTTWKYLASVAVINPKTMKPEVIDLFNKGATVNNAGYPITYMTPGTFAGLKDKNNNRLDPAYANQNGTGNQPFNVLANFYGGTVFAYLTTTVIGGAGTASNPYIGAPTSLVAGDELAIEGSGISDPTVSGPAATPSDGGWVVDSYTSNYVIFRDTQSVTFNPLALISGFDYDSTGPVIGQEWFVTSSVLGSGSLGSVEAVPESSTWAMMMAGFAGLGFIGCRAARKTAIAA